MSVVDTLTVSSKTIDARKIPTSSNNVNQFNSLNLLGIIDDPVFGTTEANFITQVLPEYYNVNFGNNPQIDSVRMKIKYTNRYGNDNVEHNIEIYKVSQKIISDTSFYSDFPINEYLGSLIKQINFNNTDDNGYLNIDFPNSFGEEFLNASSTIFENSDNFLDDFHGLYFKTNSSSNGGNLVYFNLLDDSTKLTVYYSNDTESGLSLDFLINSNCMRVNSYSHDDVASITTNDSIQQLNYLQPLGGVLTQINFPTINKFFAPSQYAISKAELIIYPQENIADTNFFKIPSQLYLHLKNEEDNYFYLPDAFSGSPYYAQYFGGFLDEEEYCYKFNITKQIQQIIDEQTEYTNLFLLPYNHFYYANRLIINSGNHSTKPMKLKIYYNKVI